MRQLGFKCPYTTVKDVEGTSPCGRQVVSRKRGEARCLGHWVIDWLVAAYGGGNAARARSAYGLFFSVWWIITLVSCIKSAMDLFAGNNPEYAAIETAMYTTLTGATAGVALGFTREHPFGGWLWLTFAPLCAVTLLLEGRSYLTGVAPPSSTRLVDVATAFADFVLALIWLAGWLIFLMESIGRHRMATYLTIFSEGVGVCVILAGVGVALASHGTDTSMLVMLVVMVGLATIVRGVTRLKKLAKVLRV